MVDLHRLEIGMTDETLLRELLERHVAATESVLASTILSDWQASVRAFWRVAPSELPAQEDVADPGLWFAERSLDALHAASKSA
jgi:glutamate synthase domain-containing protein 3